MAEQKLGWAKDRGGVEPYRWQDPTFEFKSIQMELFSYNKRKQRWKSMKPTEQFWRVAMTRQKGKRGVTDSKALANNRNGISCRDWEIEDEWLAAKKLINPSSQDEYFY